MNKIFSVLFLLTFASTLSFAGDGGGSNGGDIISNNGGNAIKNADGSYSFRDFSDADRSQAFVVAQHAVESWKDAIFFYKEIGAFGSDAGVYDVLYNELSHAKVIVLSRKKFFDLGEVLSPPLYVNDHFEIYVSPYLRDERNAFDIVYMIYNLQKSTGRPIPQIDVSKILPQDKATRMLLKTAQELNWVSEIIQLERAARAAGKDSMLKIQAKNLAMEKTISEIEVALRNKNYDDAIRIIEKQRDADLVRERDPHPTDK